MRIFILAILALAACGQKQDSVRDRLIGRSWKTVTLYTDGVKEQWEQKSTFIFTSDSAILVEGDTRIAFVWSVDGESVRLMNPQDRAKYVTMKIDRLTDTDFDFTLTGPALKQVQEFRTTRF